MHENEISHVIVNSALEVHRELGGPGLLEGVYEEALAMEIEDAGLRVDTQRELPIYYKGRKLRSPLRLDLLVEGKVIVECKAVPKWNPIFQNQVLTYLRVSDRKLGMAINFGEARVKDGIHRVVNGL